MTFLLYYFGSVFSIAKFSPEFIVAPDSGIKIKVCYKKFIPYFSKILFYNCFLLYIYYISTVGACLPAFVSDARLFIINLSLAAFSFLKIIHLLFI